MLGITRSCPSWREISSFPTIAVDVKPLSVVKYEKWMACVAWSSDIGDDHWCPPHIQRTFQRHKCDAIAHFAYGFQHTLGCCLVVETSGEIDAARVRVFWDSLSEFPILYRRGGPIPTKFSARCRFLLPWSRREFAHSWARCFSPRQRAPSTRQVVITVDQRYTVWWSICHGLVILSSTILFCVLVECIGSWVLLDVWGMGFLIANSGLEELMKAAFAGLPKMLGGKKFPVNVRTLRMVVEELLRNMARELDILAAQSQTAKHWLTNLIKPVLIMMIYVPAGREGEWALHLHASRIYFHTTCITYRRLYKKIH